MTNRAKARANRKNKRTEEMEINRPSRELNFGARGAFRELVLDGRGIRFGFHKREDGAVDLSFRLHYASEQTLTKRLRDIRSSKAFEQFRTAAHEAGWRIGRILVSVEPAWHPRHGDNAVAHFVVNEAGQETSGLSNLTADVWDVCLYGRQFLFPHITPSRRDNTINQYGQFWKYLID